MIDNTRSRDGFALRAAFFYAASYVLLGVHLPFFPVWLQASGFDAGQVGAILAATALLRVISVPVATGAADGRLGLRTAIVTSAMATALGFTALGLASLPWLIVALTVFTAFVHVPSAALMDAYTLRGLRARGAAYGPVRLWGSIFFILANLGAGVAFDLIDAPQPDLADRGPRDGGRRHFADADAAAADRPARRRRRTRSAAVAQSALRRDCRRRQPDPVQPCGLLRVLDHCLESRRLRRRGHRRALGAGG
jgi:hypothetical protein